MKANDLNLGIVGLGYVGLPLAVEFGKKRNVVGFDINSKRIEQLKKGVDLTLEIETEEFSLSKGLTFSSDFADMKDVNCFIVTVPTPIDDHKRPDLNPLLGASKTIGKNLKKGDVVIYESTVYPGATEEECVPVLEEFSGLKFNEDFFCGYSPERINPGDKNHRLTNILKITSGSTDKISNLVDELYKEIIIAGTHKASSIRVAEAAKVIENTQRDVNIALINELSIIFGKLGIDTLEVLEAAGTKWNFLPFKPGLVGGHCIGVDPYYLTYKAQSIGYHPEIILAGRRLNDDMGKYVVNQLLKEMITKNIPIQGAKVLLMGLSFKENCPDLRNTRVTDIIDELKEFDINPEIIDPWCSSSEVLETYGLELQSQYKEDYYDAVIVAVGHDEFISMGIDDIRKLCKKINVLFDLKGIFSLEDSDIRL